MTEAMQPTIDSQLIVYNYTDETLVLLREQAKEIHLASLDDEESLKKVRDMRLMLRSVRVAIEKRRKELKDSALKYGQRVDAEAKRITAIIEPQETRLIAEEESVEREKQRVRDEAARRRQEMVNQRVREVAEVGMIPNVDELASMPDQQYWSMMHQARADKQQRDNEERMARAQREADDKARAAQQKALDDARAAEAAMLRYSAEDKP